MAEKKYTFYVHTDATKSQVADAVEKCLKEQKKVYTMNPNGKRTVEEDM